MAGPLCRIAVWKDRSGSETAMTMSWRRRSTNRGRCCSSFIVAVVCGPWPAVSGEAHCLSSQGYLIGARPENACEPIEPPPARDNLTGAFIVLIKRFDCNFDIKVLNAQKAGYKAAIVHNVDSDDLISMGSNDLDVWKQIDIPSVFVGEDTANSLKEDYLYEKGGHVILMPDFSLPLEYYLIPFLIIVGICLILIVVFMITKFVQDRHRARRSRLRKDQLKKLPIHKYKKGKGNVAKAGLLCL
ncbi:E3 ubiquitin-protein ligase RNF13 [Clupea harengus]|uniref:E3 ubiquitin-protein ligase RNF13 n=1 Tax=Clupea harengus TaxID=7950 RepID=A0A6P8FVJ2_CLUHA|nr:E3 ubiquitin-protein ligase RNF13 [Clupea harengus]